MEEPPKKYFRLAPGQMVRLKGAYIIQCDQVVKDPASGEIQELHCSYFPDSRSGSDTSGLKAKGTLHWVSAPHAIPAEIRMYDRLFAVPDPTDEEFADITEALNPNSLQVIPQAYLEPSLAEAKPGDQFQFMRKGYFCVDPDSQPGKPVFNLTVGLKDTWQKMSS